MKKRILILGYARHGKDSVAERLRDKYGYKFVSSSDFVGREIIWEQWGKERYDSYQAMFDDRANHRQKWMEMIVEYNTPDKSRTARTMLERGYDIYVGMRRLDELKAARHLFDCILWVQRDGYAVETGSMDITLSNAKPDWVIYNNSSLDHLALKVNRFISWLDRQ